MSRLRLVACLAAAATLIVATSTKLSAGELRRRGMIGIQITLVTEEFAKNAGLDEAMGLGVAGIIPDMPAGDAGLQAGDVIIKVADKDVTDLAGFQAIMKQYYSGDPVPFTVARSTGETVVTVTLGERPRETSEDYDVIYSDAEAKGHKIRTIITKPKADGKYPAVLFLGGIGADSIEFTGPTAGHPFKRVIDAFTDSGIVTMRAHVIGAGDSEGPLSLDITLEDEVASHRGALAALKKLDYVDADNIFIYGHSVGGTIAPLVAEGMPVKGIITFAVSARPMVKSFSEPLVRQGLLEGLKTEEAAERGKAMEIFVQNCFVNGETPATVMEKYPDVSKMGDGVVQNENYVFGRHYRYFQGLADTDLAAAWKKLNTNVLAIWGTSDYVANREDSEFVVEQVNAAHKGKATYKELSGVDHNLDRMADQEESLLAGYSADFNPILTETAIAWIKDLSKS